MEPQTNDVETKALELDQRTRARLAMKLIRSLDNDTRLSRDEIDALWMQEAEERLRRLESGEDSGVEAVAAIAIARENLNS
ncbi:MAG: addiction module protein [bacterium]|nr:addiction module protein [bacterium]